VPMPRYQLGEEEMAIMISYLKTSSSHYSPGISDSGVRFATVMTDELGQEGRDAILPSCLAASMPATGRPGCSNSSSSCASCGTHDAGQIYFFLMEVKAS
jgi:hypothetical protein